MDIPEMAKECDQPAEPEIVVDNNATRTIGMLIIIYEDFKGGGRGREKMITSAFL